MFRQIQQTVIFSILCTLTPNAHGVLKEADLEKIQYDANQSFPGYIIPNEASYFNFEAVNRGKKGVLISLGTFRALVAASYGNFNEVILADLDQSVVDFNKKQIEYLQSSETVVEFLAKVGQRPYSKKEIEGALNGDAGLIKGFQQESQTSRSIGFRYLASLIEFAQTDPSHSFLKDPAAYQKLRQLALNGKIHSMAADLTSERTYLELAQLIRADKNEVSVIDVSNAPDYIIENQKMDLYLRNLQALPLAKNAIVNFTTIHGANKKDIFNVDSQWTYVSVPAKQYIEAAQSEPWNEIQDFQRFLRDPSITMPSVVRCKSVLL
ncbi:MAG: hypothetical protein COT73_02615 [Bdellovibrio sp. CG10_big_fil_rev_8_21_14_0_10_47_8]|nr:MAG: hypothetical protein COT73_02615 [Bdellovibrio sp. CG10_big_fil_rev_8_21_14_0_10_47_8]